MKAFMFLPVLLAAMLAGPVAIFGQSKTDKKVERVLRKIEKQTRKLQELQGETIPPFKGNYYVVDTDNLERMREIEMKKSEEARAKAEEAREQFREQAEAIREEAEEKREQAWEQAEAAREKFKEESEKFRLEVEKGHRAYRDGRRAYYYRFNAPHYNFEWETPELPELENLPELLDLKDLKIDLPENLGGLYYVNSDQDVLAIDKKLAEETNSADFNYELKEGATALSLSVNGSIDAGKVVITITRPDGEEFNQYTLSPLANVTWRQTLSFEDQEENTYLGKWKVNVAAEQATGHYQVKLRGR